MTFFRELQRRKVFRVAAAYAVVAWLLIQVADTVFPALLLPGWTLTFVTIFLVLGFPAAIVLAWALDLTPDGIRLERQVGEADRAPARPSAKAWAYVLSAVVFAAIAAIFATRYLLTPAPTTIANGRPSIAVLPFEDLSPDGGHEYFADGIAEELLNELARLEGLEVASRTSSFAFKGSGETATSIGQQLGVGMVVEGSIRINDDSLRVTAQLINVADGFQLWSEPYDRQLADVFEIQEEIARTVAGALGVQFGIDDTNAFRGAGTRNVEAYDEYLRSVFVRDRLDKIRMLEHAVAIDPDYAEAWAHLGFHTMSRSLEVVPSAGYALGQKGLSDIQHAIDLDPENAHAHAYLGAALYWTNRWIEGQREMDKAIALRADDVTLGESGYLLFRAGLSNAALLQYNAAAATGRLQATYTRKWQRVFALAALRRFDEARILLPQVPPDRLRDTELLFNLSAGTPEDVRQSIAAMTNPPAAVTNLYQPLLDVFDDHNAVVALLHEVYASGVKWPSKLHDIARLAAYFENPDFALEVASEEARFSSVRNYALWMPHMSEVRKLPGFKEFVTEVGLVDYWRQFGWSDFCRPLSDDDFACD